MAHNGGISFANMGRSWWSELFSEAAVWPSAAVAKNTCFSMRMSDQGDSLMWMGRQWTGPPAVASSNFLVRVKMNCCGLDGAAFVCVFDFAQLF